MRECFNVLEVIRLDRCKQQLDCISMSQVCCWMKIIFSIFFSFVYLFVCLLVFNFEFSFVFHFLISPFSSLFPTVYFLSIVFIYDKYKFRQIQKSKTLSQYEESSYTNYSTTQSSIPIPGKKHQNSVEKCS